MLPDAVVCASLTCDHLIRSYLRNRRELLSSTVGAEVEEIALIFPFFPQACKDDAEVTQVDATVKIHHMF